VDNIKFRPIFFPCSRSHFTPIYIKIGKKRLSQFPFHADFKLSFMKQSSGGARSGSQPSFTSVPWQFHPSTTPSPYSRLVSIPVKGGVLWVQTKIRALSRTAHQIRINYYIWFRIHVNLWKQDCLTSRAAARFFKKLSILRAADSTSCAALFVFTVNKFWLSMKICNNGEKRALIRNSRGNEMKVYR